MLSLLGEEEFNVSFLELGAIRLGMVRCWLRVVISSASFNEWCNTFMPKATGVSLREVFLPGGEIFNAAAVGALVGWIPERCLEESFSSAFWKAGGGLT